MFGISPKQIILDQLENRFKKAGVKSLYLIYDLSKDLTTCKGKKIDDSEINIPIDKTEHGLISGLFLKKIKKVVDYDFEKLIVQIDIELKQLDVYAELKSNELKKIDLTKVK